MENIATPLPAKTTSLGAIGKHATGQSSTDKALFDAFLAVDGVVPDAKKKSALDTLTTEKPAQHSDAPVGTNKEAPLKVFTKKAGVEPKPVAHDNTPIKQDNAAPDDDCDVTEDAPVLVAVLKQALKDPSVLSAVKKALNLDDNATAEDVLNAAVTRLPELVAIAKTALAPDADITTPAPADEHKTADIIAGLIQTVVVAVASEIRKLTGAEGKLNDNLHDLQAIGSVNADDAIDAAVAKTLDAVADWKAAVAHATGEDTPAATDKANDGTNTKTNHDAPHPLAIAKDGGSRAESIATGGRPDVNLANSQASTSQTLPLLPTQLTGGQQRLPVATSSMLGHTMLGSDNLDVIARPLAGATADAASKLTKNSARLSASIPAVYEQVSVRLNRMAKNGDKSMTIQLNPIELGRVEVKLDISKDASVTARIMADNQQTLDLMQRDSKALERALADAGLKVDNNSLQFDLRQGGDGQAGKFAESFKENNRLWQQTSAAAPLVAEEIIINVSPAALVASGRIDIQA